MNTYKIRANQTVTWYSTKTGRKMTPSTRLIAPVVIEAASIEEALTVFKQQQQDKVTLAQKRDLSWTGTIYTMDGGRILSTYKF